jgi:hypothetical protein
MKNRKEIIVSPVILFTYNMALVVLSAYMLVEVRLNLKTSFNFL